MNKPDISELKALADDAKALLETKAFTQSILELRKHWLDELMAAAPTTERKLELISMMRALEAIPQELKIFIGNYHKALKDAA